MPFTRHLDNDFIEVLNQLYSQPTKSWWKTLVDHDDIFIAIRNNSINAYANGGSIGRITWQNQNCCLTVHIEYLTLPAVDREHSYFNILQGLVPTPFVVQGVDDFVLHLDGIRSRAALFAGEERYAENRIACRNLNVVDIEAAYTGQEESNPEIEGTVTSNRGRFDLVTISESDTAVTAELKMYANSEIRSRSIPAVCDQLLDYWQCLEKMQEELAQGYSNVLTYFNLLHGRFFEKRRRTLSKQLTVDPIPRLLIVGFDGQQQVRLNQEIIPMIIDGVKNAGRQLLKSHIRTRTKAENFTPSDLI